MYGQKWRESSYRHRSPACDAQDDILRELKALIEPPKERQCTGGSARGPRVADIGCGTGRFLHILSKSGYQPCGIDIADNCRDAAAFEFDFVCSPVTELPAEMEFDAIVCIDMLEHIPEELLDPVLAAIRKLSGKAVISASNFPDEGLLHCSLHPPEVWQGRLQRHYAGVHRAKVSTNHFRQNESNWFLWRCLA